MESHSTVGIDSLQMQEHENGLAGERHITRIGPFSRDLSPLLHISPPPPCRLSPGNR